MKKALLGQIETKCERKFNLARTNFGEWPINLNLPGRDYGKFGELFS